MAEKLQCPACAAKLWGDGSECTACGREIEVLCWEITSGAGNFSFRGKQGLSELRERLVDGTIALGDRCRQLVERLVEVVDGTDRFEAKEDRDWKPLREYAQKEFALRALYDPVGAYGTRSAYITWAVAGIAVATAWNADGMLAAGAHPVAAVLLGLVMVVLFPTVIGVVIGALVIGAIYGIPGMGVGWRALVAVGLGAAVGGAIGWTIGYGIGALVGLRKSRAIVLDPKDSTSD